MRRISICHIIVILLGISLYQCTSQNKPPMESTHTNALVGQSSPYLLQHAHNPIDWNPWNEEALTLAKKENKLLLISVGYAACHWCHVMEHESFEDTAVAAVMNAHFVNIKVDREERPDVDQVYMSAVQLMTGSGGWPLNVVALPDGRPVWGGTYFPKGQWIDALKQIHKVYQNNPEKMLEYADKLEEGIRAVDLVKPNPNKREFTAKNVQNAVEEWKKSFDLEFGGSKRVPKFMMPTNYQFLQRYAHQIPNNNIQSNNIQNQEIQNHVDTTLTKMAYGGLYDQLGGGFARYSTDAKWHIPHFEKMLYDNAQLVSLYSAAYRRSANPLYKEIVYETLDFIARELTDPSGAFYSSLDADSLDENGVLEEGAYYVWSADSLKKELGDDFALFKDYYNINSYGLWEHGNYVLIRKDSDAALAAKHQISRNELQDKKQAWKSHLLPIREKRPRPRLDDKSLTSWNALMLQGYLDAYRSFRDKKFLFAALKNATFIQKNQQGDDGSLLHSYKDGKSQINGYLEDYAAVIQSYISLYQTTMDTNWLERSKKLTAYVFAHFYDSKKQLFYFTSDKDPALVTRKMELNDNVIPASNSIMAKNLQLLSHFSSEKDALECAQKMLHALEPQIMEYPAGHANWLQGMLDYTDDFFEIIVIGPNAQIMLDELRQHYLPNAMIAGSVGPQDGLLFKGRFDPEKTLIYVCVNNACKYPVTTVDEALKLIH